MSANLTTRAGQAKQFVRPVGRGDYLAGVAILSVVALFCTALLIRGIAPRGTLWGANAPVLVGVASSGATLSGGTMAVTPAEPSVSVEASAAGPSGANDGPAGQAPAAPGAAPAGPPAIAPSGGSPAAAPTSAGTAGPVQTSDAPPPPSGPAGTARQPASGSKPAAASGPQSFLPVKAPAGYAAGQVGKYNSSNLFEKIDGKADSYLDYGFVGLETMTFSQGGSNVDVYIYDMGNPLQASGMLNSERSGTDPVAVGQEGYKAGGSVFFRADRYYTQIMVNKPDAASAALSVAQELNGKMPKTKFTPPGVAWFPKDGLVPGSVKWVRKKVASVEGIDDGYQAQYQQGNEKVDVFLVRRDDPAQLATALNQYQTYLKANGAVSETTVAGAKTWLSGAGGGPADTLFTKGKFIGGTIYVSGGKAPAEAVTAKLVNAVGG